MRHGSKMEGCFGVAHKAMHFYGVLVVCMCELNSVMTHSSATLFSRPFGFQVAGKPGIPHPSATRVSSESVGGYHVKELSPIAFQALAMPSP